MKVGIFNSCNGKMSGCYKVVHNLIDGLKELGHEVLENQKGDLNGCLQHKALEHVDFPVALGPEVFVLPDEKRDIVRKHKHLVQPSQWVVDYQSRFDITKDTVFHVWPVGVDHRRFRPRKDIKRDCLIYVKDVTKQVFDDDVKWVIEELEYRKQSYQLVKYGQYNEDMFIKMLNESRYAVWLAGTESQNIAIMEAWSMDVPTYILDCRMFMYSGFRHYGASSAPYNEASVTGETKMDFLAFDSFLHRVGSDLYNPRLCIEDGFTNSICAEKYLKILEVACA